MKLVSRVVCADAPILQLHSSVNARRFFSVCDKIEYLCVVFLCTGVFVRVMVVLARSHRTVWM